MINSNNYTFHILQTDEGSAEEWALHTDCTGTAPAPPLPAVGPPCCASVFSCIQVSQEAGKVVWYSHPFKNLPQFVVIHNKGFSIVSEAEVDDGQGSLACCSPWGRKELDTTE